MEARFPYEPGVELHVRAGSPRQARIRVRVPAWATAAMAVSVNGREAAVGGPGSYVCLDREWRHGDVVAFVLPLGFRTTLYRGSEAGFDDGCHYALEYGPLLLALRRTDGGPEGLDVPLDPQRLLAALRPLPGQPLHFAVAGAPPLEYVPYFEVQDEAFTCFPRVRAEEP